VAQTWQVLSAKGGGAHECEDMPGLPTPVLPRQTCRPRRTR